MSHGTVRRVQVRVFPGAAGAVRAARAGVPGACVRAGQAEAGGREAM
ncbi:hypothetical protein GCM10017687_40840 [Streptomyces echinatus]